jgi:hypothetical protein
MPTPTDEQRAALDVFATTESMAVSAYAGTGKTSTLVMMARAATTAERRGRYVAFNRAIVEDGKAKFPSNVSAQTAHAMAWRAVVRQRGSPFDRRLGGDRIRASLIARRLGMDPFVITYGTQRKVLQPGYLASLAQRTINRFCSTADPWPTGRHVPYIDGIDLPEEKTGARTYENNNAIATYVAGFLDEMWADVTDPGGTLPFRHEHYLKMFELSAPKLHTDFILYDEAQDVTPVMNSIVEQQVDAGTQIVYVGDEYQAIYEWTGAVDALSRANVAYRTNLTQSFRFGPQIAWAANAILSRKLGATEPLLGTWGVDSRLRLLSDPDVLLCRTNAVAMESVLDAQFLGRSPHLLGGGTEILRFARAAQELMEVGKTAYFDLACFDSWEQAVEYSSSDPQGDELTLNVSLVEQFGVEVIVKALGNMPGPGDADLVVSTAHKCKGLEWDSVKLARDFDFKEGAEDLPPAEWRLLYVACTRARTELDVSAARPVAELLGIDHIPDEREDHS